MRSYRRKVRHTNDGDTFEICRRIQGSNKIRLASVWAPEGNTRSGKKATNTLKGMIGGRTVTIRPVARDRYGRIVAEVFADRKNVNRRMSERGY